MYFLHDTVVPAVHYIELAIQVYHFKFWSVCWVQYNKINKCEKQKLTNGLIYFDCYNIITLKWAK
jgi:hypothetical protein